MSPSAIGAAIGTPFNIGPTGLCAEYKPVYEAQTVKATGLQKYVQNLLCEDLAKTRNFWNRFDIIRFYANHINTAGEALINWKQPAGGSQVFNLDFTVGWTAVGTGVAIDADTFQTTGAGGLRKNTIITTGKTYRMRIAGTVSNNQFRIMDYGIANTYWSLETGTFDKTVVFTAKDAGLHFRNEAAATTDITIFEIYEWTNATAYNAPTHTPDQGFLFDGLTNYIDNNWIPSVSGVNFTQNSASQILYIRTDVISGGYHGVVLSADNKDCGINPRSGANAFIRTNDATTIFDVNTNGSGLFINTRTAAAVNKLYRNGAPIINGVTVSTGLPTHSPYTGVYNANNVAVGFRADQVWAELWGDGMDSDDAIALTAILNDKATRLGVNVF